jgi:pimeloyl-ACP methyl ester carboxylesterase
MAPAKIRWFFRRRWLWIAGAALVLIIAWQLVASCNHEEEKALRTQLRTTLKETFPDQNAAFMQTVGLYAFDPYEVISEKTVHGQAGVVLIHGLDDPGKVWRSLAPALAERGDQVWLMNYPNDQPVMESAHLLFGALKRLRSLGIGQIAIVAHSMGGLVSREMLTSPDVGYRRALQAGEVPEVELLIMVGTPNHGSQLVRLRFFTEVRDQFARLTHGEAAWLGAFFDGAGEAKIDLLPDSLFLTTLNRRPQPQGVEQLIIAGVISPWSEGDVDQRRETIARYLPDNQQAQVLIDYLMSMTNGLGDGLVTVESTRLPGVAHRTVAGSHLSMIRNLTTESQRVPPAVPIIVDKLQHKRKAGWR